VNFYSSSFALGFISGLLAMSVCRNYIPSLMGGWQYRPQLEVQVPL
jgi:hypothetical protein